MTTNSDFSYALSILWLLTENEMIHPQLRKGNSPEEIIKDLKSTILLSNCLNKYSEDIKVELTDCLFFIIKERTEESSKMLKNY
ncbi:hypothetical protein QE443_001064 [Pantoea ananatis]|uniref:hypothetical protein n=1 Tax=Pantoea TaxID=53335 RepID=UPI0011B0BA47|nr:MULTISPECIES: hypothetical protein [Pantoea]MCU7366172.1 hypothetical protein [Pantoea stewartii]MDQ1224903.1 hypothetical protein [Pantoea ananatis]MDR6091354.1 hypothetical protein [Pantoea ananatis]